MQAFVAAVMTVVLTITSPVVAQAKSNRSHSAITAFKHAHPCPATGAAYGACPGWVIDHRIALACGGEDAPSNMQWQTIEDAKEKDRWERKGCKHGRQSNKQIGG